MIVRSGARADGARGFEAHLDIVLGSLAGAAQHLDQSQLSIVTNQPIMGHLISLHNLSELLERRLVLVDVGVELFGQFVEVLLDLLGPGGGRDPEHGVEVALLAAAGRGGGGEASAAAPGQPRPGRVVGVEDGAGQHHRQHSVPASDHNQLPLPRISIIRLCKQHEF